MRSRNHRGKVQWILSIQERFYGLADIPTKFQEKIDRTLEYYTSAWLHDIIVASRRDWQEHEKHITIHMPQRTSNILLVRLTANKNAFLFQIRVTSFARSTE